MRSAFDDAPTGIVLTSLDGRMKRVNATFLETTGRRAQDVVGTTLTDLVSSHVLADDEVVFTRGDGTTGWALWRQSIVRDPRGQPVSHVTPMHDISERKAVESELDHRANHDELTGLPTSRSSSRASTRRCGPARRPSSSWTSTSWRSSTPRSATPPATSCS